MSESNVRSYQRVPIRKLRNRGENRVIDYHSLLNSFSVAGLVMRAGGIETEKGLIVLKKWNLGRVGGGFDILYLFRL